MIEIWKTKAPRQAEFFQTHLQQVRQQSRDRPGFGACQWLPTQNRLNKHLKDPKRQKCFLCLSDQIEDMAHLWTCPALAQEQAILQDQVSAIVVSFPFTSFKLEPRQSRLRREWFHRGNALLHQQNSISETRRLAMTRDFWEINNYKEFIGQNAFLYALSDVLPTHSNEIVNLCPKFMSMVAEEFSLNTEGFSNALQHSVCFNHWCSESPSDTAFGTMGSCFAADLVGKNIFAFPPPDSHEVIIRCLERCSSLIDSKVATRVVLLLNKSSTNSWLLPVFSRAQSLRANLNPIINSLSYWR